VDSADSEDTNTFEILSREIGVSSMAGTNSDPPKMMLSSAPPPEGSVGTGMEMETSHPDPLGIDWFPDGCLGMLLGMDQGLSTYKVAHNTLGDSVWVPFQSQCDWEVVQWAKMCGPTSTAMTELLTIPEVCNC
jgi:hypothetical protein